MTGDLVLVLDSHNVTSPVLSELVVLVELSLEGLAEVLEISKVFSVDCSEGNAGSGLLVNEFTEVSLSTDEAEGDILLSAEIWEMDDEFDWVNIVGNDDELGFAFFDKGGHVVETELDMDWLGGLFSTFGLLLKSQLLFSTGFWGVFGKQFKELGGYY